MKRRMFALALTACFLMAAAGCGAADRPALTPDENGVQGNGQASSRPEPTPENSGALDAGGTPAGRPQESTPPPQDGAVTPELPGQEEAPSGTAPPSASVPPLPTIVPDGGAAPLPTAPPTGTVVPPGQTPGGSRPTIDASGQNAGNAQTDGAGAENQEPVISQITQLERGFSSASFSGDDGFEAFLEQGGAATDAQVTAYLASLLTADAALNGGAFGCSTIAVTSPGGNTLFGRNFDWQACDALVLTSTPTDGYASLSTVNLDFISAGDGGSLGGALERNDVRVMAALYAPLDGMNEKGLAVSVNMIQDAASIDQDTGKPDLTTTTAIRLLLNQASNVEEALELLRQYDLHASLGMMVHFALADTTGRSVAVEYVNNAMVVTETPVVTNFYLAQGAKHGIGSAQSHTRYDILTQALEDQKTMDMNGVRDALDSVSKDSFGEFESTEWSAVFNLSTGEARYYHRENYTRPYEFTIQ